MKGWHDTFFVPVLMYGSEAVIWNGKERSRGLGLGLYR